MEPAVLDLARGAVTAALGLGPWRGTDLQCYPAAQGN